MPDLFANMRIKQPDTFFEYQKLRPEASSDITDHYIKFIEPVYEEEHNTIEKCWSFGEKIYEITEDKKKELISHAINISPSDYEWVIDIFEKTAINDGQQSKKYLINSFRERAKPEVSARVTNEAMEKIYDHLWKS